MMDKLIEEVKDLVTREYGRAADKFGSTNSSDHESYAVLLEEREEARDECEVVDDLVKYFWNQVKHNYPDEEKIKICQKLQTSALLAACELIQVAAMAKKAAITIADRNVFVQMDLLAGDGR